MLSAGAKPGLAIGTKILLYSIDASAIMLKITLFMETLFEFLSQNTWIVIFIVGLLTIAANVGIYAHKVMSEKKKEKAKNQEKKTKPKPEEMPLVGDRETPLSPP